MLDYDKIHLFRLMDEHNYLTAGDQLGLFDYGEDVTIGAMICYDLRFPQLSRTLVNKGRRYSSIRHNGRQQEWTIGAACSSQERLKTSHLLLLLTEQAQAETRHSLDTLW